MTTVHKGMSATLTLNEWIAITNSLRHMSATYVKEGWGVDLENLADQLSAKLVKAQERHARIDARRKAHREGT